MCCGWGEQGAPLSKEKKKKRERVGCVNKSSHLKSSKDKREAKWNKT